MWLLNTFTIKLEYFSTEDKPQKGYAILSHTWGSESEEVTFRDIFKESSIAKCKLGYHKVRGCCEQARKDGYDYAWVDSCCIDKRSSAELTEAINTMFKWYQDIGRASIPERTSAMRQWTAISRVMMIWPSVSIGKRQAQLLHTKALI